MSNQTARKAAPEAEPDNIRAWTIVYVPFEDGPGGGYELREMHMTRSQVEAVTARQWAPELMAIVVSKLAGRVHAVVHDMDSADRDTY